MLTIMEIGIVDTKKKRLTLDLDSPLQRRLKAVAALPFGREALDRLEALQSRIFQGRTLPGDSAELIREARAGRTEAW